MFKNALLTSVLGLSIYALATNANAGLRPQGWYVGIEGGANWTDDADLDIVGLAPVNWEAQFDSGWAGFVDIGYRFENNWRLELEGGWRDTGVDCVSLGGPCLSPLAGKAEIQQVTPMINIVHDVEISEHTELSAGIGLGADWLKVHKSPVALQDDTDWVFAGQVILQLTHQLTDRLDFVLTYRFEVSDDPMFDLFGPNKIEMQNQNHTVTVGLRFDLQPDAEPMAPEPAAGEPPPAPPPAARLFVIYFGFNKSNLTSEALQVVKEAAATAQHDGIASIVVTGHTDASGSAAYNQRLSERRAASVKDALVQEGIPASGITAVGKGKTQLSVQTGDRRKEARNRRATIDLDPNGSVEPAYDQPSLPSPAPAAAPEEPAPAAAPASTPAPAPASSGAGNDTSAQYRAWIAEARAKHPYPESEDRMFGVLMCESRGNASIVNPAGPYYGLFQYKMETWKGAWNDYRQEDIKDARAQIFATAQAWQHGMQHQWGCYNHPN